MSVAVFNRVISWTMIVLQQLSENFWSGLTFIFSTVAKHIPRSLPQLITRFPVEATTWSLTREPNHQLG